MIQVLDGRSTFHKMQSARTISKWLFPPRFSDKNRLTSSGPDIDAVLVAPISAKS